MNDSEKFFAFIERRYKSEESDLLHIDIPVEIVQIVLDYSYIALDALKFLKLCVHEVSVDVHYGNYPKKRNIHIPRQTTTVVPRKPTCK